MFTQKNISHLNGGFLKWWYPTTIGFPTKNDLFGVFWGYPYFRKPPFVEDPRSCCHAFCINLQGLPPAMAVFTGSNGSVKALDHEVLGLIATAIMRYHEIPKATPTQ